MRVLHITSWYPNTDNPSDALWTRRHINSLGPFVEQQFILHFEIKPSKKISFQKREIKNGKQRILHVPIKSWLLLELLGGVLITYYLIKLKVNRYTLVNFHTAYPLLVYWHWIRKLVKIPIVITEHWSAYHFNFGVNKPLPRVQRIFMQNIPVIAVSNALAQDIKNFANSDFRSFVVPNVVDASVYYPHLSHERTNDFFMVSQWKWPKRPLVVLEAFAEFVKSHPSFKLKIGGYGTDYEVIRNWVKKNKMDDKVLLLGRLQAEDVANELMRCKAFIHCSEYETFSVVCAEAMSCHTPVIASNVGGIAEVVSGKEGILLESMDTRDWSNAMKEAINKRFHFRDNRFTKARVGEMYFNALLKVKDGIN